MQVAATRCIAVRVWFESIRLTSEIECAGVRRGRAAYERGVRWAEHHDGHTRGPMRALPNILRFPKPVPSSTYAHLPRGGDQF